MADRKKVIKALTECIFLHEHPDDDAGCFECPYRPDEKGTCPTMIPFLKDVLELLKEQETMEQCIKTKCVICPHCEHCDVDENGLLKEQEPRVLTTEELFNMEHKGVYLERRNSRLYYTEPSIVLRTEVSMPSLGGKKYVLMRENKLSDPHWACDYNKAINDGWRCWTLKPTEEQRKEVKWDD